ncbi:hypothetical protein [Photobacterium rosenbergii]|uniref:Uncharacterized protein n=1 Tax=Photobacterium rosenbergii TaxID=294936 RepID=A0ABU3ZLJ1_9GAMM|nr:hypothetical protein [Photobacterium rosenbergii]MDV5170985.1 hypothetical protein [Photobacterium rosenbergii]
MAKTKKIQNVLDKQSKKLDQSIEFIVDELIGSTTSHFDELLGEGHASPLKYDAATLEPLMYYVDAAIEDVRVNGADLIDEEFCKLHDLPSPEHIASYSDIQALYVAFVVPELFPDVGVHGDIVDEEVAEQFLFPALARRKAEQALFEVKKIRKVARAGGEFNTDLAVKLVDDLHFIEGMLLCERQTVNAEPYVKRREHKKLAEEELASKRRASVKNSSSHKESAKMQPFFNEFVNQVHVLMAKHGVFQKVYERFKKKLVTSKCSLDDLEEEIRKETQKHCSRAFSVGASGAVSPFDVELANLADKLDFDIWGADIKPEDFELSRSTINRHVVKALASIN